MNPRQIDSLKISSLGALDIGTLVTCVKTGADAPSPKNCLLSWPDGEFAFHLLPQQNSTIGRNDQLEEPEYHLIHEAGSSNAVWLLGTEVVCKVHAWKEGIDLESQAIAFIREHFPAIPVPEVLYEWVDKSINRTFLIMKRIRARTLDVACPQLTHQQRLNIAEEMAEYTALIAIKTSTHYQTVSGCGVRKPWLMQGYDFDGPIHNWFPRTIGPFTASELRAHWTKISTLPPPALDDTFVLYHDDQGPTNILISDSGDHVAAIVDWANVSYVPRFWVATVVLCTGAFRFQNEGEGSRDWTLMFAEALKMQGFEECVAEFRKWHETVADYDTEDDNLEWSKVQTNVPPS